MKLEDYQKDIKMISEEGWKTSYYKGLGKLSVEEYREMLQNPVKALITYDDADKISKTMKVLFSKDTETRKKWLQGEIEI